MPTRDPDPLGQGINPSRMIQGTGTGPIPLHGFLGNLEPQKLKPVRWEYKTLHLAITNITSVLNKYGEDGWELVGFYRENNAVMKRAKYGD